ncbi:hypothetical protein CSKR_103787 [Clonorchis sinensis]|uniref:ZSWIM1/3 RNaseH-like domain-containing protein n=1 Tax=Clonorchis sinensis TaxID=79923 RepID=A0A419PYA4_CLOSI|nr:hypothetical protein CSKR_103787 [Clonorchis sinensis]
MQTKGHSQLRSFFAICFIRFPFEIFGAHSTLSLLCYGFRIMETPTLFCVTNGCTTNAAGDLQEQWKVAESEEASKLSVFANKKPYVKHRLSNAVLCTEAKEPPGSCQCLYDRLLVNRQLTEDELGTCRLFLKCETPSCEVRQFVADEFGKILTIQDIYNSRRKCRPALLSRCRIDVVNVEGTHATNRFGYKLRTFLITDGMGIGRPVMYAFVESEQFAPTRRMFDLFKNDGRVLSGQVFRYGQFSGANTGDKSRVRLRCKVLLLSYEKSCQKALLQTHRLQQDLQLLRRPDPRFVSYLTARWLYITRKCAIHAHSGMVHFGNVTNNRLGNADGRLKDQAHHADTLNTPDKRCPSTPSGSREDLSCILCTIVIGGKSLRAAALF